MTWEEERKNRYRFKNIYQSAVMNIDRIHPLQQKNVISIVREVQRLDINKILDDIEGGIIVYEQAASKG